MKPERMISEINALLNSRHRDEEIVRRIRSLFHVASPLSTRSIHDLRLETFVVPSYQRGYRWKTQQVIDLLHDIGEFLTRDHEEDSYYCLQPVIVRKGDQGWVVIDGQQRLTTIYLILRFLNENPFQLEYDTRVESSEFLEGVDNTSFEKEFNAGNIDIHHFQQAMETIRNWFRGCKDREAWKKTFLNRTRVIWYAPDSVGGKILDIDVFSRINSGKIPLTNSELIRALFIHHSGRSTNEEAAHLQRNKIASEWDKIEQQLNKEEFWCFITLGNPFPDKAYPNHIDYLFDLIELREGQRLPGAPFSSFRMFSNRIAKVDSQKSWIIVEESWQDLKNLYYRFLEWSGDRTLYHLIGYVCHTKMLTCQELLESAGKMRQSELVAHVKESILRTLFDEGIREKVLNVNYSDNKPEVSKILLLFNIALAVNDQNSARFSFSKYTMEQWDIEHIQPQNPKENADLDQIDLLGEEHADFIGNLCLLDASTNRSYGNDSFQEKREKIRLRIAKGVFIPQGTQSVFMKIQTTNSLDMGSWQIVDAEGYREGMIKALEELLMETKS